jgi:hypothetical protein
MIGCTPCGIILILHSWRDSKLLIKLTKHSNVQLHFIKSENFIKWKEKNKYRLCCTGEKTTVNLNHQTEGADLNRNALTYISNVLSSNLGCDINSHDSVVL